MSFILGSNQMHHPIPLTIVVVVVIILIQWNINQHHTIWTKDPPPHWKATTKRHQVIHWMKRKERRPKKKNNRLQHLHTMTRIISIPPWEERIYEFCLPWPLVATLMNSQITRTHHFPRQRHTIPKSNLMQQH